MGTAISKILTLSLRERLLPEADGLALGPAPTIGPAAGLLMVGLLSCF